MGGDKTKIDLEQLRSELQNLNPDKSLFRVLKEELGKLGYWKNKPRGSMTGLRRLKSD